MGRKPEAIEAYERAVELYAAQGFVARAAAMAKVVIGIDSSRIDVLERVYPKKRSARTEPTESPSLHPQQPRQLHRG
jgi:hypothetical protein